jgi:ankyrin repeat protein
VPAQAFSHITELMIAASRGDMNEARRLVDAGAPVDAVDHFGNTALHYAALAGHADVIELLLLQSADTKIKNKQGQCCIDAARSRGHAQAFSILRGAELLLLIQDGDGAHALELLDAGLDVDVQAIGGWTPLMVAALENQPEMVELLLERGARLDVRNAQGLTAEDIARRKGHERIINLLTPRPFFEPPLAPEEIEAVLSELDAVAPEAPPLEGESDIIN